MDFDRVITDVLVTYLVVPFNPDKIVARRIFPCEVLHDVVWCHRAVRARVLLAVDLKMNQVPIVAITVTRAALTGSLLAVRRHALLVTTKFNFHFSTLSFRGAWPHG